MRALAGPAMLLVMVGGFALYRMTASPDSPSRDFLDLELAGADADHTGSCYSLSTVIVAHTAFTGTQLTWTPAGDDGWMLSIDNVVHGARGPEHWFQHLTFREQDDQARLVSVDASEGQNTEVAANLDAMLEAPNRRHSTPVDRCVEPGATGYLFKRK